MKVATILVSILIVGYGSAEDEAECTTCLPNGVNCISEREYKICKNKKVPLDAKVYSCSKTEVCTDEIGVCLEKVQPDGSTIAAKCTNPKIPGPVEKLSECGVCLKNFDYACVGIRTFAFCMGREGKDKFNADTVEDCPKNYVCNTATDKTFSTVFESNPYYPCIPSCAIGAQPSCEKDLVPTEKPLETCKDALKKSNNQATFQSLSTDCSMYVYCEHSTAGGESKVVPFVFTCKEGQYFDNIEESCVAIPKGGPPKGCSASS